MKLPADAVAGEAIDDAVVALGQGFLDSKRDVADVIA